MRFYAAPSVSVSSTTGAVCAAVRVTLSAVRMVPSPSAYRMATLSPTLKMTTSGCCAAEMT